MVVVEAENSDGEVAKEKARAFLEVADDFRLGQLVTESPHPRDGNLSEVAERDVEAALGQLFDIDRDVVEKYREWVEGGSAEGIAKEVADRMEAGGKVFFTGCGATGRLSIQLASMWRDYWQRCVREGAVTDEVAAEWAERGWSVMAGGDFALIKSVEGFEDYAEFGGRQIEELGVGERDVVFACTEGGETSFVIGTAWKGLEKGAQVYFVYNNPDELLREKVARSREVLDEPRIRKINLTTGPMAVSGSTRMQATTMQLCVLITVLDLVLLDLRARMEGQRAENLASVPRQFLTALEAVSGTLRSLELRRQVACLVKQEAEIFRARKLNNYFADRLGIDVLTDTTERSPTFGIPTFKKFDDDEAAESWSFLFLPHEGTEQAWQSLLHRELQPVEWSYETVCELIGEAGAERQFPLMRRITREEILRFRIGLDGLSHRRPEAGDGACAILREEEADELLSEGGFFRKRLEEADAAGALTAVVFSGPPEAVRRVEDFLDAWKVKAVRVLVPLPDDPMPLRGTCRIATKMLLNALSTLTMVRLGRVDGNLMTWVVPGNLKLIDRAIRYVRHFTGLGYEEACHLVHRAIEYIGPRRAAGEEYPPVVALCRVVHREGCCFEAAEERILFKPENPAKSTR